MNPQNYLVPILDMYCQWLNKWLEDDKKTYSRLGDIQPYTIKDFMPQTVVIAVVPGAGIASSAAPRFMVVVRTVDEPEGQGHDLTAWFEVNEDNTTEIVAMVQGFDTNMQFIYEDRKFLNLPS